jgi:hypothetical protein
MKNFFSIKHLKEVGFLLFLESLMIVIGLTMIYRNDLPVSLFNLNALIISVVILLISSILYSIKYFNFWTFLSLGTFIYMGFWVIFELTKI